MTELLGLPLDEALAVCARLGLPEPRVLETNGRRAREDGIVRVVRARDGEVTVSRFPRPLAAEAEA